jgi:hypothetical protein
MADAQRRHRVMEDGSVGLVNTNVVGLCELMTAFLTLSAGSD